MTDSTLNPVILGYGRCGRELHLPILRQLRQQGLGDVIAPRFAAYDPVLADGSGVEPDYDVEPLTSQAALEARLAEGNAVAHVCTPHANHAEAVRFCLDAGARAIVVEKPVANTASEVVSLDRYARKAGRPVYGVTVWTRSQAVAHLRTLIESRRFGEPLSLHFVKRKARLSRNRADSAEDVLDVEAPHMVALSCELFGTGEVLWAHADPITEPPDTGAPQANGVIRLRHPNGAVSTLESDLASPRGERRLEVEFTIGWRVVIDFPYSERDPYCHFRVLNPTGERVSHTVLEDAALMTFMRDVYGDLAGRQRPAAPPLADTDLKFQSEVIGLIERAREVANARETHTEELI